MTPASEADENAVAYAFLQRYSADLATPGGPRVLSEYQALYPGFDAVIAREFAALHAERTQGSDGDARAADTPAELEQFAAVIDRGRYRVCDQVARGGMGVILRVRDQRLRRELAMKVMAAGRDGTSARDLSRFLDEAHITGSLGHPGIAPVHDLGIAADGRAFFTMPLIQGRSFGAVIDAVHAGEPGWSLERALGVVLRVCETVAFAHSRGVIHRDLKPGNVMVGAFGETYVLDWGLARVSDRADAGASEPAARLHPGIEVEISADRTMAGDVIGTPAYMSPEQARGDIDRVDARSDVYSIGAMIYHLITGVMPFATEETPSPSSAEVLASVRGGPPLAVLARRPGAPPAVVAICERAMQRDPERRYRSAAALGEDLRAFLELRVVKAYASGPIAELRQWVRRNRGLAAMAAIALLGLTTGLVFSMHHRSLARVQAQHADENFRLARDSIDRMLVLFGEQRLANLPQMRGLRRDLLREALTMHEALLARRRDDPTALEDVARSALRVARIRQSLGEYEAALAAARRAIEGFESLGSNGAEVRLARAEAHDVVGVTLVQQGDHDAAERALRTGIGLIDELLRRDPDDLSAITGKISLLNNLANSLSRRADPAGRLGVQREAMALAEKRRALRPDDGAARDAAALAAANLGLALGQAGDLDAAEERLRAAIEYGAPASPEHEREGRRRHVVASAHNRLANLQFQRQDGAAARASLEAGVALLRALVADHPQVPSYHRELGASLSNLATVLESLDDAETQGRALEEAEREHAAALRLAADDALSARLCAETRRTLCRFLLAHGRHRDAARRVEDFAAAEHARLAPLEAARFAMQCAALAAADTALTPAERERAVEDDHGRAVRWLGAAAREHAAVADDAEFAALRARADFAELVLGAGKR